MNNSALCVLTLANKGDGLGGGGGAPWEAESVQGRAPRLVWLSWSYPPHHHHHHRGATDRGALGTACHMDRRDGCWANEAERLVGEG